MPISLKCMIGKWLHKGQISQQEYDEVMKKLDGHDAEIKGQIIRDVLETVKEQNEIYLAKREKQIKCELLDNVVEIIKCGFDMQELYLPIHFIDIIEETKAVVEKGEDNDSRG